MLATGTIDSIINTTTAITKMPTPPMGLLITFFTLIPLVIIIGLGGMVLWIITLVNSITREDLKYQKIMWVLVIIFTGALGGTIYGFVENNKKLAIWNLVMLILSILAPFLAIFSIVGLSLLGN